MTRSSPEKPKSLPAALRLMLDGHLLVACHPQDVPYPYDDGWSQDMRGGAFIGGRRVAEHDDVRAWGKQGLLCVVQGSTAHITSTMWMLTPRGREALLASLPPPDMS